ncbi:MAG TPA: winged helix-turn-helix domain-containing protein [Thermoanaerobaculia bacterium]|nr:winged helix-turn-helix domain-containing protein [Thermoanaerobaculia bacterium]
MTQDPRIVRFADFTFDRHTLELRRNGEPVKLQQQPARLLAVLIEHAGDLVTRETLQKTLWGDDTFVDFDRGLNYCVKQIRAALGDSAEAPRFLETLRGRGYRFIGGGQALLPVQEKTGQARVPVLHWVIAAAAVIVVVAAALVARSRPQTAIGIAPLTAPAAEEQWAGALRTQLVSHLANASRTPVIDLVASPKSNTRWRVEGRVDRSAEQYRVTMLLRDMNDGSVRWSDIFAGAPGDWIDAQSDMAQRMTEIIRYRVEGPSAGLPMRRKRLGPTRAVM